MFPIKFLSSDCIVESECVRTSNSVDIRYSRSSSHLDVCAATRIKRFALCTAVRVELAWPGFGPGLISSFLPPSLGYLFLFSAKGAVSVESLLLFRPLWLLSAFIITPLSAFFWRLLRVLFLVPVAWTDLVSGLLGML